MEFPPTLVQMLFPGHDLNMEHLPTGRANGIPGHAGQHTPNLSPFSILQKYPNGHRLPSLPQKGFFRGSPAGHRPIGTTTSGLHIGIGQQGDFTHFTLVSSQCWPLGHTNPCLKSDECYMLFFWTQCIHKRLVNLKVACAQWTQRKKTLSSQAKKHFQFGAFLCNVYFQLKLPDVVDSLELHTTDRFFLNPYDAGNTVYIQLNLNITQCFSN